MRGRRIARLSLTKNINGPPVAVRDGEDQKIADTEDSQLPFSCAERVQNPRYISDVSLIFSLNMHSVKTALSHFGISKTSG